MPASLTASSPNPWSDDPKKFRRILRRLVWNRLTYVKDPDTGKRRSRARADRDLVVKDVPELRIVDQELWDAVRARQARLDAPRSDQSTDAAPEAALDTLERLADAGVVMTDVEQTLEDEGVHSFSKSFDELLQSLRDKAATFK